MLLSSKLLFVVVGVHQEKQNKKKQNKTKNNKIET